MDSSIEVIEIKDGNKSAIDIEVKKELMDLSEEVKKELPVHT